MRALRIAAVSIAAAAVLAACEGDLPKATEIARMRVLGAQFSVEGDETRATPQPGETLHVSLPTVFPTLEEETLALPEVQALIVGCTAPTRFTGGLPICQEFIDAATSGQAPTAALPIEGRVRCDELPVQQVRVGTLSLQCVRGAPAFDLLVDDGFDAEQLLIRGVVCEHGSPYIDPEDPLLFGCAERGAEAIRVHGSIPVQQDGEDENHNPDISALTVLREVTTAVPWDEFDPEDSPPAENCRERVPEDFSGPVHPIISGENIIQLRYDGAAREEFAGEPEDLEITVYATGGEVARRFTLFEGSAAGDALASELGWEPPDNDLDGALVRLFITLRDQRGGFAMTTRAACVYGAAAPRTEP